jgi:hypothetical protein
MAVKCDSGYSPIFLTYLPTNGPSNDYIVYVSYQSDWNLWRVFNISVVLLVGPALIIYIDTNKETENKSKELDT